MSCLNQGNMTVAITIVLDHAFAVVVIGSYSETCFAFHVEISSNPICPGELGYH